MPPCGSRLFCTLDDSDGKLLPGFSSDGQQLQELGNRRESGASDGTSHRIVSRILASEESVRTGEKMSEER